MRTRLAFPILVALALIGAACPKENSVQPPDGRSADLRPPRDGNVAIREELDAARRTGTIAAYDLFIARHPDHPLASIARRERARLIAQAK